MDLVLFILSFALILSLIIAFVVGVFAARKTSQYEELEIRKAQMIKRVDARARQAYAESELRELK